MGVNNLTEEKLDTPALEAKKLTWLHCTQHKTEIIFIYKAV